MQDRIRQILESQIAMRGDSRAHYGSAFVGGAPVGGTGPSKKSKAAARRNPWISYLKYLDKHCNIPYNVGMADEDVKKYYIKNVRGSGMHEGIDIYEGSAPIRGKYYPKVAAALKKRYGQSAVKDYRASRTKRKVPAKRKTMRKTTRKTTRKTGSKKTGFKKVPLSLKRRYAAFLKDCYGA